MAKEKVVLVDVLDYRICCQKQMQSVSVLKYLLSKYYVDFLKKLKL